MRLTPYQITAIRETIEQVLDDQAVIRLFGSRTDDSKRGGDVDLYVEVKRKGDILAVLQCKSRLEELLDLHVDLLVKEPGVEKPIYQIARKTGVIL